MSSRRSFLHGRKHSQNKNARYDSAISLGKSGEDATKEERGPKDVEKETEKSEHSVDAGGDEAADHAGRDEQGYRDGERKKGLLRKLNLHKV